MKAFVARLRAMLSGNLLATDSREAIVVIGETGRVRKLIVPADPMLPSTRAAHAIAEAINNEAMVRERGLH